MLSNFIASKVNKCINEGATVDAFKKTGVQPLYKADGKPEKWDYRPINVLFNVSKIYERCLYDQSYSYFNKIYSRYKYGFCKGTNTQHIHLAMIEVMKISRKNKQFCAAILADLSKPFHSIYYGVLVECMWF